MTERPAPRGVFCAALTPLDEALAPDLPRFAEHCRWLIDEGCDGVALLGTTGEANSFSVSERKAMLEAVVAAGVDPKRLMPGTGVAALTETVDLTAHALSLGVTDVVLLPPYYYKGVSDDGLFASYSEVIERVGDARLRVVLYHIPQFSYAPISHDLIERLLKRYPATVVGIKDSAGDRANMSAMLKRFPGFSVFPGADPLMLPLLAEGAAGCITAASNFIARDLQTVFQWHGDPDKTDAVEAAQARIVRLRELSNSYAQMPTLKAMTAHRTGHEGWRRLRPPLVPLGDAEDAALAKTLPFSSKLVARAA